jgi:hypothetical protein
MQDDTKHSSAKRQTPYFSFAFRCLALKSPRIVVDPSRNI